MAIVISFEPSIVRAQAELRVPIPQVAIALLVTLMGLDGTRSLESTGFELLVLGSSSGKRM